MRSSPSPGFVLKLSSPQIDLGPSRTIDDRGRAQLRDRQLVLDADDQVAAVLALRNSVRQLETRVAELQLKLAGMPSSFPAPRAAEVPAAAAPAATPLAPAPVVPAPPPSPAPPSKAAAAQEPVAPPVTTSAPPPSPAAEPAATAAAPADKVEPPVIAETPRAAPAKKAAEPAAAIDWRYYGLWALAALLILAAILLALRLARRRREAEYAYEYSVPPDEDQIVVADEPLREDPVFSHELEPEVAGPARRELDADVDIATRLDGDTDDLRRRYIEERFPEIGKGAISLEDPDSVVKGARLFYEDRAVARAVELLHYAIERHPGEVKTWLALFEIFRLERLAGEFAELARRFRERHGKSDYWRKVQYFGREIDPGNALYAESPVNTFETIGPSQAKRLAADNAFDPVAENWLGAPMDFQNEVLANELRMTLMAEARISEQDLVPNPMPALRNVEMFNVA